MSTHVIHRVAGDLAPSLQAVFDGQDLTGWSIRLLGVYRNSGLALDIAATITSPTTGEFEIPFAAGELAEGVADIELEFTPTAGGVFTDDLIDGYMELKMEEVTRLRMTTHPVEFDMYYSL